MKTEHSVTGGVWRLYEGIDIDKQGDILEVGDWRTQHDGDQEKTLAECKRIVEGNNW